MLTMQVRPMRTISVRTPSTSWTACKVWDKHHAVKLPGGKGAEALVQVGLDHIQAAADAGEDLLLVQLDADQAAVVRPLAAAASNAPEPQPRSSTLAPGGISSTMRS